MSALLFVLLSLPLPSADACADVFDRTERCAAVDEEALPAPVDPVAPLPPPQADVGLRLGWPLLAGSATSAVLAGAAGIGSLVLDTQLSALEASGAAQASVDQVLWQRTAAQVGAGALLTVSGLLAGTSVAFLVFDPSEGRVRESFRIEE